MPCQPTIWWTESALPFEMADALIVVTLTLILPGRIWQTFAGATKLTAFGAWS